MPVVSSPRGSSASLSHAAQLSERAAARPRPKQAPPVPGGRVVAASGRQILQAVQELSDLVDAFDLYAQAPLPPGNARPLPAAPAMSLQNKITLFERLGYRHLVHLHPGADTPPPLERNAVEQRGWLQVTQERHQAAFYLPDRPTVPKRQSLPPIYPPPPAYQAHADATGGRATPPVCRYRHWPKSAGKAPNKPLCAILEAEHSETALAEVQTSPQVQPGATGLRRRNNVRTTRRPPTA